MVEQVSVFLENTTGRLAELTRALGDAGINMRALMVADTTEFGVVRIICDTPRRAVKVLDDAGFGASLTEVLAVEVPDRPGGLADVLEALQADGINVEYAYCFVEPSGDAAIDILRVDEPDRAREALARAGIALVDASALYEAD
ncbi:MAG: ACT domain-containing protein [Anaerosomatales bacterium]|nr:ACT domain-containing protein [Anaerosomatales bacterium]MDI6844240.1 ACT domain-containing protein [Anaerosomatales bacterium]